MIGNPPFLGGKLLIGGLGEDYVAQMFAAWEGPRAGGGGSRLLLVREGGRASDIGQSDARRTRCDQLDTWWCKTAGLCRLRQKAARFSTPGRMSHG